MLPATAVPPGPIGVYAVFASVSKPPVCDHFSTDSTVVASADLLRAKAVVPPAPTPRELAPVTFGQVPTVDWPPLTMSPCTSAPLVVTP